MSGVGCSVWSVCSGSIGLGVVGTIRPIQVGVLIHYNKNMPNICLNFIFIAFALFCLGVEPGLVKATPKLSHLWLEIIKRFKSLP